MQLVVDMGNTRLKWASVENGCLSAGNPLLNTDINAQSLYKRWHALPTPKCLVIACVTANQWLNEVIKTARDLWHNMPIVYASAPAHGFGVSNAYPQAEKLGVDRWLALIAARYFYTSPVCVVDCGTAITIDLMNADGQHTGGFISAGLTLMKQALAFGTDALPFAEQHYGIQPARATEAAIYAGTLLAAVGLIKQVLAGQSTPITLLLTGGDAELIATHLTIECFVYPDLVLRGLAIIADTV